MNASRKFFSLLIAVAFAGCGGGGSGAGTSQSSTPGIAKRVIAYSIDDFTGLAINGSFTATVQESPDFRVEITIDEAEAHKLDVRRDGINLNIGFLPGSDVRAETLRAVVEMPVLHEISLFGSNHVETFGFSGSMLAVASNGDNLLECTGLEFDFIAASSFGSSLLNFENIAPVPAAHVELSGSSTAIINLMDAATVTGALLGTSALSYYGSDVFFDVSIAGSASLTRLGGTL